MRLANRDRSREPSKKPKSTWLCAGFMPVEAFTRTEARTLFKRQLQEMENLSFAPRRMTRLPAGAEIIEVKPGGTVDARPVAG